MAMVSKCVPLPFSQYVGVHFRPTDEQLLQYLNSKIHSLPYFEGAVFDCDLYGEMEPWQIWDYFKGIEGEDLYFFTKLKRTTTKNSGQLSAHVNRKIGLTKGTWSGENSANPIFDTETNERIIGYRKRFRYENAQLLERHGEWIMHEYSLNHDLIHHDADPNYVLCRMRKNERPKRKAEKISSFGVQPTKKRIMAPMMSQMRKNETSSRKEEKISYSDVHPTEQRVMTHEMPTNQYTSEFACMHQITIDHGTSDIPNEPEIIINQGTSNIPYEPEITINQGTSDISYKPEIIINQGSSDISYEPEIIVNQGTSDIPYEPEITINQATSDISYMFEMPTDQGMSDAFYDMTTHQNSNCMLDINDMPYVTTNEETTIKDWRSYLDFDNINEKDF